MNPFKCSSMFICLSSYTIMLIMIDYEKTDYISNRLFHKREV